MERLVNQSSQLRIIETPFRCTYLNLSVMKNRHALIVMIFDK